MKVKSLFLYPNNNEYQANATLDVPGLGEVQIKHCLSADLINRICEESVAALRLRLGQTLTAVPPAPIPDEAPHG